MILQLYLYYHIYKRTEYRCYAPTGGLLSFIEVSMREASLTL